MSRQLLCAGVLGVLSLSLLGGCSNASLGPESNVSDSGTLELPLTAVSGDVKFRLNKAKFTIKGVDGKLTRTIKPPADVPIDQEMLPAGSYQIKLEDGWVLEAKGPKDKEYVAVEAELITPNPDSFDVIRGRTVNVVFAFGTPTGVVALEQGRANVRISVQDCTAFNAYAATIATATVDCLGRIDQFSYLIDDEGNLIRNFTECRTEGLLETIDGFLGLQFPRKLPEKLAVANPLGFARECIADRWAAWREAFDASGIGECPDWEKLSEINTPTEELYARIAKSEPILPTPADGRKPTDVLSLTKVNALYAIKFPAGVPTACKTPADCAEFCAAGFPGFVIDQDGETVLTDPPAWDRETVFGTVNPYLKAGYYHPMSLYGEIPGEIFSHVNRTLGETNADPLKREQCSYYDSGFHVQTWLKRNCAEMPDGTESCVGVCSP